MSKHETPIRSMDLPDGQKAEICSGQEATKVLRSSPDLFRRLLEQQVEATYEVPRLPFWRVRVGLRNLFGPVVEQIGQLSKSFDRKLGKPLMDFLYPPGWFFSPNKKKELEWIWDDAQSLLDQGNFALVKIDGAVVALCAYKLGGKMPDNRDVYEISKSFTTPEFQGKGLNRQLRERVVQMITDRHPGAPIMSFTKNRVVIEQCIKLGWQDLSIEEYSDITRRIGRSGICPEANAAFQHWKGFLLDPQ
ncbi:MAG: GNAT family N-acetyltransferase [Nitrososphaera sp.]